MKDQKTQVQVLILGVLVLGLVGFYLWPMLFPSQPAPAPAAAKETAAKKAASAKVVREHDGGPMGWVEDDRVQGIVTEVTGGRDPFDNLMIASPPSVPTPAIDPIIPPGSDERSSYEKQPGEEIERTYSKTLEWVTPTVVRKQLEDLDVTITKSLVARRVLIMLKGYDPEFTEAVSRLKALDVEPPTPNFVLSGIVVTATERYVALRVDGKYYTLLEHETIPGLGWTVVKITSTDVILAKGKQIVPLRLSGGNPT